MIELRSIMAIEEPTEEAGLGQPAVFLFFFKKKVCGIVDGKAPRILYSESIVG